MGIQKVLSPIQTIDKNKVESQIKKISFLDRANEEYFIDSATKVEEDVLQLFAQTTELDNSLRESVELNIVLKNEAKEKSKRIQILEQESIDLKKQISDLENSTPGRKDLEQNLRIHGEEVTKFSTLYKQEVQRFKYVKSENDKLKTELKIIVGERSDFDKETKFKISKLENELLRQTKTILSQNKDLQRSTSEQNRLHTELSKTKLELKEIYQALKNGK